MGGEAALERELEKDMSRLWKRNLGRCTADSKITHYVASQVDLFLCIHRDDRCAADHQRELWFPYIDENVVAFLQSLDMCEVR